MGDGWITPLGFTEDEPKEAFEDCETCFVSLVITTDISTATVAIVITAGLTKTLACKVTSEPTRWWTFKATVQDIYT